MDVLVFLLGSVDNPIESVTGLQPCVPRGKDVLVLYQKIGKVWLFLPGGFDHTRNEFSPARKSASHGYASAYKERKATVSIQVLYHPPEGPSCHARPNAPREPRDNGDAVCESGAQRRESRGHPSIIRPGDERGRVGGSRAELWVSQFSSPLVAVLVIASFSIGSVASCASRNLFQHARLDHSGKDGPDPPVFADNANLPGLAVAYCFVVL